jgi:hypothetical protein
VLPSPHFKQGKANESARQACISLAQNDPEMPYGAVLALLNNVKTGFCAGRVIKRKSLTINNIDQAMAWGGDCPKKMQFAIDVSNPFCLKSARQECVLGIVNGDCTNLLHL